MLLLSKHPYPKIWKISEWTSVDQEQIWPRAEIQIFKLEMERAAAAPEGVLFIQGSARGWRGRWTGGEESPAALDSGLGLMGHVSTVGGA